MREGAGARQRYGEYHLKSQFLLCIILYPLRCYRIERKRWFHFHFRSIHLFAISFFFGGFEWLQKIGIACNQLFATRLLSHHDVYTNVFINVADKAGLSSTTRERNKKQNFHNQLNQTAKPHRPLISEFIDAGFATHKIQNTAINLYLK